jgi:hypothetical protein
MAGLPFFSELVDPRYGGEKNINHRCVTDSESFVKMSFYTTHVSNASMDMFPGNTPNEFKNSVPDVMELEGEWEVGLGQVTIPFSWNNINAENSRFCYFEGAARRPEDRNLPLPENAKAIEASSSPNYSRGMYYCAQLDEGYYDSVEEILSSMTESLAPVAKTNISFKYKKKKRRVEVRLENNAAIVWMLPSGLRDLLGFDRNVLTVDNSNPQGKPITAKYAPDYKNGITSLFVYCDIITSSIVGNELAPLLRTVPVTVERDQLITANFDHPDYYPLKVKGFTSIGFEIRDDSGSPIKFESGKVILKLHFRKRK